MKTTYLIEWSNGEAYQSILGISTLHNVCAVQRGLCSTTGDVQYTRGYHEYNGGYHEYSGGYHEYTVRYHEYTGGVQYTLGVFSTLGDIMINVGKVIGKTIEFVWKPQCTEQLSVYS